MVTIRDVARRASVSPSTVSNVLNGRPRASEEVRERVLEAVAALHYTPNPVARSLRTRRHGVIALLLPDIANPFFPEVAKGVEEAANRYGYRVILSSTGGDPKEEQRSVQLIARQVDGIIAVSVLMNATWPGDRHRVRIPVVMVNRRTRRWEGDFVGIDNRGAAREATLHLIQHGHRRIAFIAGSQGSSASEERRLGYQDALVAAGLPRERSLVHRGHLKYEDGQAAVRTFLERSERPTAILAADDIMAIGVLEALDEQGVRVPEDVAVMGFDDIWMSSLRRFRLTTVYQPRYEMGASAMDILVNRITRPGSPARNILLAHRIVERGTV